MARDLSSLIGLEYNERLMEIACQHNSMFANTPEKAAINNNLQCVGKNVLSAVAMISVFRSNKTITASELLNLSNTKKRMFSKEFLKKYAIKPFFSAIQGVNIDSIEESIVIQILGVLFICNEPLATLDFLNSVLDEIETGTTIDYKTIVQEYAQKQKIPFNYETIGERGNDNDKTFTVQLIFGKDRFIAEGKTKKKATVSAAEKCVITKRLPTSSKQKTKNINPAKYSLNIDRINELQAISKIIGLKEGLLSFEEIDSAFTHASFFNTVQNKQLAVLYQVHREIGAHLLLATASKLLFSPDTTDNLTLQIREMTARVAIEQAVDKRLIPYIRMGSKPTEGNEGILSDCYKAFLAVLFIKYAEEHIEDLLEEYNVVSRSLLANAKHNAFIDYTTRLQEMAQDIGSIVEYHQLDIQKNTENNSFLYLIEVTYSSDEQTVQACGEGKNLKSARNDASRNLIKKLLNNQKQDSQTQADDSTTQGEEILNPEPATVQTPQHLATDNNTQSDSSSVVYVHTESRKQYKRSREVASYVKICSGGICELCNQPAPFLDLAGRPYLECHHVIWLSKGGSDSVMNAVALCPTCHRKIHILNRTDDMISLQIAVEKHKSYFL